MSRYKGAKPLLSSLEGFQAKPYSINLDNKEPLSKRAKHRHRRLPLFLENSEGEEVKVAPAPAWNNDDMNSEGEEVKVAPAPAWNNEVEELFSLEQRAPPMPQLRSHVPAWTLSPVEGMENRMKSNSNGPKGRGFRTRKRKGGRRKKNRGTRRRNHKA